MIGDNSFSETICSICYEDLKPIVEDLQSISVCGHVFHELCLQQWFEYCFNSTKKYNCPVCKQNCLGHNATRLYFQSIGDISDLISSQKLIDREHDAEALRSEVKKLQLKASGLSSALKLQEKKHDEINEELCLCKEQIKKEVTLKNEALREKACIQQKLNSKSEELNESNLECLRLEQRNMALAKELAVLKLVSDLDLDQEEMLKLASLGNEANSQDTIDNLIRSLASHKKSYKELMAKCNLMGRSEARLQKKLEKAKAKIDKLKTRMQEMETLVEVKDNKILRALKASKRTDDNGLILKVDGASLSSIAKISSKEHQMQHSTLPLNDMNISVKSPKESSCSPVAANHSSESPNILAFDEERDPLIFEDAYRCSIPDLKCQNGGNIVRKPATSISKVVSDVNGEAAACRPESGNNSASIAAATKPMFNIKAETPSSLPLSEQGNICFSGGLLGPDGTKWHLGKWCKRGKMLGSKRTQGTTNPSGDLIAVGADGRGGRIKVMRSLNQSAMDGKENSVGAKRLKFGAKTNSMQSQGCLQIEHFFGKAQY